MITEIKTSSPRERLLLRQANRVTDQGKLAAAKTLYDELLAEFPNSVGGYLGLARLADDDAQRDEYLQHALTIDPKNSIVQAALEGESIAELLNPPEEPEPEPEPDPEEDIVPVVKTADGHVFEGEEVAEVGLRCNRCGKPIEAHNAIRTPVGYRCRECVREVEEKYFTASSLNYITAIAVALPLASIAAFLVATLLGGGLFSFLIALFVSPTLGTFVGTMAFRAAGKNRGRYLPHAMAACIGLGAIPALLFTFNLIVLAIYVVSASGAAFFRVR